MFKDLSQINRSSLRGIPYSPVCSFRKSINLKPSIQYTANSRVTYMHSNQQKGEERGWIAEIDGYNEIHGYGNYIVTSLNKRARGCSSSLGLRF